MKEYQIEVTTVTTVYVEADSEDEALNMSYEMALSETPDKSDAAVVNVTDLED